MSTGSRNPRVLICMSDGGQDVTECAIPWNVLRSAHVQVDFATETGNIPAADARLLEGMTQKLFGAAKDTVVLYRKMALSVEFANPKAWSHDGFSMAEYDGVLLPGGHEKKMRQYIESASLHQHLARYVDLCRRSDGSKVLAAICHGVLALSKAQRADSRSVLYDLETTTLSEWMEKAAFYSTRLFMGDYFKTYENYCAHDVQLALRDPGRQYKEGPWSPNPFFHVDPKYYYVSARFPGDAKAFADCFLKLVLQNQV